MRKHHVVVVALWLASGCRNPEPAGPDAAAPDPTSMAADTGAPSRPPPVEDAAVGTPSPTGASCLRAEDCDSGVCEGLGCGDDEPGTCMDRARMCTRDSRPYCGCDGQTFRGSGSCPGARYAHPGECDGTTPSTP